MRKFLLSLAAVLLVTQAIAGPPYGPFPTPDDYNVKNLVVDGTTTATGVQTFAAQPIFSTLTASKPVFTDSSKGLVSTGTLGADQGGTGLATYTIGDIPYASAATTISKLAGVATGNALISGGVATAPSFGKIGLTTHVSGTLAATNGGTGLATWTAGDIPYASATNTIAALAKGTANQVLAMNSGATAPAYTSAPIFQRPSTTSVADTYVLTSADCGRVIVGTKTSATQVVTLPAATVAGCQLTFIAGHADGEILINSAADGDGCVFTSFTAVGADADTAVVSKSDCAPGVKNTTATNAIGDSITLVADGVATWFGVGVTSGIWASQ